MFVTLFGIAIVVSSEHPEKAEFPMLPIPSGTMKTPFVDLGTNHRMVFAGLKRVPLNPEHPEKADTPILFTLSGIVIAVSEEHPEKA